MNAPPTWTEAPAARRATELPADQPSGEPTEIGADEGPDQDRREVKLVLGGHDRRGDQQRLAQPKHTHPTGEHPQRQRYVIDVNHKNVIKNRQKEQLRRSWHTTRPRLRTVSDYHLSTREK